MYKERKEMRHGSGANVIRIMNVQNLYVEGISLGTLT